MLSTTPIGSTGGEIGYEHLDLSAAVVGRDSHESLAFDLRIRLVFPLWHRKEEIPRHRQGQPLSCNAQSSGRVDVIRYTVE